MASDEQIVERLRALLKEVDMQTTSGAAAQATWMHWVACAQGCKLIAGHLRNYRKDVAENAGEGV